MDYTLREEDDTLIVAPEGRLDTESAPVFGEALASLLQRHPRRCLIDMSRVGFLSSSGLQVLLAGAKTSQREAIDFGVFGMNEMVEEIFTLSGFDRFILHYPDEAKALA
jgi:anti-sigma B factor antagonist